MNYDEYNIIFNSLEAMYDMEDFIDETEKYYSNKEDDFYFEKNENNS